MPVARNCRRNRLTKGDALRIIRENLNEWSTPLAVDRGKLRCNGNEQEGSFAVRLRRATREPS